MTPEGGAARSRHMFGSYEILETVGQGGMGVVYRAHDHMLGRTVALKVLRDDLRVQEHLVSRFQREAKAVAALDHPNIVQVYSVGTINEVPYFAMEFIEGETLSDLLRERSKLSWEEVLRIGEQISQGLSAAHDKLIFHRDIKPGNILLDATGRAYLTDFGIAKVINADTQLTVDGSRLGTPQYMAPERCEGRDAGALSDLYALGIVMYQAMTGRLPFKAETPALLIEQILSNAIKPVSHYVPSVPLDVDRLIAWVTEKDPRHRPANAQRLADAMQRVLAGMPLDEAGPNLAGALAEFRDGLQTPTPTPPPYHTPASTTSFDRFERLWASVRWRWSTVPLVLRAILGLAIGFSIGAAVTWLTVANDVGAPQSALLSQPDRGISRWNIPPAPGAAAAEGDGVVVTRFSLPGYHVHALVATAGSPNPVALLRNPDAAHGTVWTAAARTAPGGQVEMLGAPIPMAAGEVASILPPLTAGAVSSLLVPGWADSPARLWALEPERSSIVLDLVDPVDGAALTVGSVDAAPNTLVAAFRKSSGTDDSWQLGLFSRNSGGEWGFTRPITASGPPIASIRLSPDGTSVAFLRAVDSGRTALFVASTADRGQSGGLLAEGNMKLPRDCWDASGQTFLTIEDRGRDGAWLVRRGLQEGSLATTVGQGHDCAVLPDGRIAVLAPDRRGDLQIWKVGRDISEADTQRTFIDGGFSAGSLIAAGDARVAAIAAESAAFALVTLGP